jgi:hypothetical protein
VKTKIIFLLIISYLLCQKTVAQDSAFYFSSKVLDDHSGKPVAFAKISLKGTLRSAIANEKGEFSILVNKKRSVLEISAPWYFSKDLALPTLLKPAMFVPLVPLSKKSGDVPQNAGQQVYKNNEWYILDYDFYDSTILLLVNNPAQLQSRILLLNERLDTLSLLFVKGNACALYKNCHGEHFLLKEESVVQLLREKKRGIYFGLEAKIKPFEKENISCVAEDESNTYFATYSSPDYILTPALDLKIRYKTLSYFSLGKEKKQRALFKNFTDEKFIKPGWGEKTHMDIGMNRLPFSNNSTSEIKVNCPLIKAGKKLCLFDFMNNKIESYDSTGRLIMYSLIYFTHKENWCGQIYADDLTGKFYTCFYLLSDGKIYPAAVELKEVDVLSGKPTSTFYLPQEAPVQLKINGGYAYYFNRNPQNKFHSLCRIKLDP